MLESELNVYGVNLNDPSTYVDRSGLYKMLNCRAELFWQLKELMEGEPLFIQIPPNEDLRRELASIRYEVTQSGKIMIESKDKIIKRVGSSPDIADAVALACMGEYEGDYDDE